MDKNILNAIGKVVGYSFILIGALMIPSLLVSFFCNEQSSFFAFGISILILGLLGFPMVLHFKILKANLYNRENIILLFSCFVFSALAGSLPYALSGFSDGIADSIFESCSCLTTTGVTTFNDVEGLPTSIILWRSLSQWMGGLAFLCFTITIFPSLFIDGINISAINKPRAFKPVSIKKTFLFIETIFIAYAGITLLELVSLCIAGMNVFDSLTCSFGTISTGGFSNYTDGIMHFHNIHVLNIVTIFMLCSSISIVLLYNVAHNGLSSIKHITELHAYLLIIIISSILVYAALLANGTAFGFSGLSNTLFQVISIITTTGYASTDYTVWPQFCQTILIMLLFIGGCSKSTSSGNNVIRLAILFGLIKHGIESRLHPNQVNPVKINQLDLQPETVNEVANHLFLYTILVFFSSFILAFENLPIEDCLSTALSLLGNVGISFRSPGPIDNVSQFHAFTKLALCCFMIAGRLGVISALSLCTRSFWRSE